MKNRGILIVLVMFAGVLVWSAVQTGAADKSDNPTSKPATEWKLPVGETGHRIGPLTAADNGRLVFFHITHFPAQAGAGCDIKHWMLNTKSGVWTDLGELMNNKVQQEGLVWKQAWPSPDGKHVVMTAWSFTGKGRPHEPAYLLTLKDGEIRKLSDVPSKIVPLWDKEKLYISHLGADKRFSPVKVFDTTNGKSTDLKICGLVAAVDPEGKFFVCVCDPDNPNKSDKPMTDAELDKCFIMLVTPEGEVLLELATVRNMRSTPILSPGGKYIAFNCLKRYERPRRHPRRQWIRIWSTDGKIKRTVNKQGWPLAITDRGEVVATMNRTQDRLPIPVKFFDADGKSRTLVKEVQAATVSGGRLLYVTPGKQPVIKSIPLPVTKEPTTQPDSATTKPAGK